MNDELNASIEMIQRITDAPAQTVQRWKNGASTPPEPASRLLRFHILSCLIEFFINRYR
jgi:DNA-binding transcriptional regulator YiaG